MEEEKGRSDLVIISKSKRIKKKEMKKILLPEIKFLKTV